MAKRKQVNPKARYDAGGQGRRMVGWQAPSSGPNQAIQNLATIRNRARDASRNDWSGESGVQKWTTSLIGIGITPRFKRLLGPRKVAVTDLWTEFSAQSDADGVLNIYGQQTLAVRAWFESGEVFVRRRFRRLSDGLSVPMQVQLIEADFCPLFDADNWPGMPAGNKIRSGIEINLFGRRVAYWMYREHPGESNSTLTASLLTRIDAADIKHIFEPKRPGQLRGVPAMASVLARLRGIGDFDDAVLERQKLANLFVAFITRTMPGADTDANIDPLTNMPIEWMDGQPLAGMSPGLTQELDPGQDVKFANPPEAGTMYSEYMRTQHMGTAAATGIPYELFSGDIQNVSDRTLRVIINEFRRFAEQRQWQVVIPMFCQPVIEWFAEAALMAGLISEAELPDVKRVEHAPHGWQYIHPVQDPQGKALEVTSGFRSRSSVIAERGDDPEAVDLERQSDLKREKALDLLPPPPPAPVVPEKAPAPAPEKKKAPSALELAQINLLNAQTEFAMREPVAQAAPVNNFNVTLPVPETTVVNNLPPTEVVNNVHVEQPDITIPAPIVNMPEVTNNIVNNVPAAEVSVSLKDRKTETVVTYDSKGNIVSTTQLETETDA
jgi:lambda family phage portal protein